MEGTRCSSQNFMRFSPKLIPCPRLSRCTCKIRPHWQLSSSPNTIKNRVWLFSLYSVDRFKALREGCFGTFYFTTKICGILVTDLLSRILVSEVVDSKADTLTTNWSSRPLSSYYKSPQERMSDRVFSSYTFLCFFTRSNADSFSICQIQKASSTWSRGWVSTIWGLRWVKFLYLT